MVARTGSVIEALVEGFDRGFVCLRLRRGGLVNVPAQKGLDIGDKAFVLYEPFSQRVAEVYTAMEWQHHQTALPVPDGLDEPEDLSRTEDPMDGIEEIDDAEIEVIESGEDTEEPW